MKRRLVWTILIPILILTLFPILLVLIVTNTTENNLLPLILCYSAALCFGILIARFYSDDEYNTPRFYRYIPRKRVCPHCKYPYASVRNKTCLYCGGSLVEENSTTIP